MTFKNMKNNNGPKKEPWGTHGKEVAGEAKAENEALAAYKETLQFCNL